MYRTYELTDKEIGKITRLRWDGDTYYYDVFESQEECDKEQERLDRIGSSPTLPPSTPHSVQNL